MLAMYTEFDLITCHLKRAMGNVRRTQDVRAGVKDGLAADMSRPVRSAENDLDELELNVGPNQAAPENRGNTRVTYQSVNTLVWDF